MFHILGLGLGFLFIIVLIILVIGLSIIGSVLRTLFGFGRRRPASEQAQHTYRSMNNAERNRTSKNNESEEVLKESDENKHKKIFTEDDGEYVDFEEIKE